MPILSKITIWKTELTLFSSYMNSIGIYCWSEQSLSNWEDTGKYGLWRGIFLLLVASGGGFGNRKPACIGDPGQLSIRYGSRLWLIRYWLHCLCSTYSVHTQNFLDRNGRKVTQWRYNQTLISCLSKTDLWLASKASFAMSMENIISVPVPKLAC